MIRVKSSGDNDKTAKELQRIRSGDIFSAFDEYGRRGVEILSQSTPKDTGETATSWHYRITKTSKGMRIDWYNTHTAVNGTPIAVLIQYGHGTGTGGYVQGRDFINPAMRPLFDQIVIDIWKKVRQP